MENVNEDLFLPEDIQTEIEKKVKELKDSDPKLKRVFPIFVEGDEDEAKSHIISVILNSRLSRHSVNICPSPKRTRPVPCENWQKIALSMAIKN